MIRCTRPRSSSRSCAEISLAVSTSTGMSTVSSRLASCSTTSKPDTCGIIRSSTTASGFSRRTRSIASWPPKAASGTKPADCRCLQTIVTAFGSSSTTSTRPPPGRGAPSRPIAASAPTRSSCVTGLTSTCAAPSAKPRRGSSVMETMTTGMWRVASRSLSCASVFQPSRPGSSTSSTIARGCSAAAVSRPRSPPCTTWTRKPSASSCTRTRLAARGSSSMTRMVPGCASAPAAGAGAAAGAAAHTAPPEDASGAVSAGSRHGSQATKREPSPGTLRAIRPPPCSSTRRCTMVSPSPVPWYWRPSEESACMKGWNSSRSAPASMPMPVSLTAISR